LTWPISCVVGLEEESDLGGWGGGFSRVLFKWPLGGRGGGAGL